MPTSNDKPVGSIDLHGYTKSEGISSLTSFLDQISRRYKGDVWVLVITGSGAHSSCGPVLRNAVQALLDKRKMKFTCNRGKGSFNVQANSGHVLYAPEGPRDTKVLLREAPESVPSLPKASDRRGRSGYDPLPAEVAAVDAVLEESREEHLKVAKDMKKGERLMKKAISLSIIDAEREEEDEERLIQRALSLSVIEDQVVSSRDDDDDLQIALELSQRDFVMEQDDDEELKRALELSQVETRLEEEEFLRFLNESKLEHEESLGGVKEAMNDSQVV
jgi:hypothetical protein